MRAKQGPKRPGRFVWSNWPLREGTKQFSDLIYQAIARNAKFAGAHFERCDAISQRVCLLHSGSNSFSALKPQPLEHIVLNRPPAIDEAEGAIKCLTTPERFVLLFW
jgi:hypothetical protein